MGPTMTNGDMSPEAQARAREGVEHLQAAARELIEAARAALDVAEEWVNDPESLASLAGTLTVVGDVAKRLTGTGGQPRPGQPQSGEPPAAGGDPRVQRIDVS
ncbi:MAG TPA: hypothetical protein VFZ79_20025 [Acidimicrobiales bacterium]